MNILCEYQLWDHGYKSTLRPIVQIVFGFLIWVLDLQTSAQNLEERGGLEDLLCRILDLGFWCGRLRLAGTSDESGRSGVPAASSRVEMFRRQRQQVFWQQCRRRRNLSVSTSGGGASPQQRRISFYGYDYGDLSRFGGSGRISFFSSAAHPLLSVGWALASASLALTSPYIIDHINNNMNNNRGQVRQWWVSREESPWLGVLVAPDLLFVLLLTAWQLQCVGSQPASDSLHL